MRLPRELDDPDGVARLRGLDLQLGLAVDGVGQVLVHAQPATGDGRVLADVLLGRLVELLDRAVELLVRRQGSAQLSGLLAEARLQGLAALCDLLLLGTRASLLELEGV